MINHLGTTTINTNRLTLRKYTKDDIESAYINFLSDVKTIKDVDVILDTNFNRVKKSIESIIIDYDNTIYEYAISLKTNNQVIGSVQLTNIIDEIGETEIGFLLGSKFWNKGYMTEAVKAVINHAIFDLNFEYIYGQCQLHNISSEKVMIKCGMKYQFEVKNGIQIRNSYEDCKIYAITKEDIYTQH